MNKNAIIIVASGRYFILGARLINDIDKLYAGNSKIDIYLHTDSNMTKLFDDLSNKLVKVFIKKIKHETWKKSALHKVYAVNEIAIENYSHIVSIDADSRVKRSFFDNEIFLSLFAMRHVDRVSPLSHHEKNKESSAFIEEADRLNYYQTNCFGGSSNDFVLLSKSAQQLFEIDAANNVLARSEDETYLQPFLNQRAALLVDDMDDSFPIEMNNKGLDNNTNKTVPGKNINLFDEWGDAQYLKMIGDAFVLSKSNSLWDIHDGNTVFRPLPEK